MAVVLKRPQVAQMMPSRTDRLEASRIPTAQAAFAMARLRLATWMLSS